MKTELLCPDYFNYKFGIKLLRYLGASEEEFQNIKPYWCWENFAKHFSHYKEKAEKYFENAKTDNPSWAAYNMCHHCGSSRE